MTFATTKSDFLFFFLGALLLLLLQRKKHAHSSSVKCHERKIYATCIYANDFGPIFFLNLMQIQKPINTMLTCNVRFAVLLNYIDEIIMVVHGIVQHD